MCVNAQKGVSMKINQLKGRIAEQGYSLTSFARSISMVPSTFIRKIKTASFNLNEIISIAKATIAAATITEADKAKAEEEAKKAEVKAQKLKEKAEKEAKKKADEIAKLQAKVDMLKASTTATTNETISVVSNSSANDGMIATR